MFQFSQLISLPFTSKLGPWGWTTLMGFSPAVNDMCKPQTWIESFASTPQPRGVPGRAAWLHKYLWGAEGIVPCADVQVRCCGGYLHA